MIERSIEEEERQQKSTYTIHFYIVLLSYWTRVQSLESKWQKYKFFMCCRPATCHYPGFKHGIYSNISLNSQTLSSIQSHLPHIREGFSLFWLTFRGRIPVCPPKKRFLTPSGVSLHFSEPRPFCITKPNNDFFYVGQTSLMRSRLVSGPAIHIAALSRRAYSVERFFICTCLFMSCYWSKPHVDNWSSTYVHSIHVWL